MKILLQDIDNVSYPFKEKHTEYLVNQGLLSEGVADAFLNSNKPYLIDFLLSELKNGGCVADVVERIRSKNGSKVQLVKSMLVEKNLSQLGEEYLDLEAVFFSTFQDFFESDYYTKGVIEEITTLNKSLKSDYPDLKIFGITARAVHAKKEPDLFNYLTSLTHDWNVKNNAYLDGIFFENKKIRAYKEILDNHPFHDVVCFVEDDPRNIEDFLKEGVNCVLIDYEFHGNEDLANKLSKKYPGKLDVVSSHADASDVIKKLI